MNGSQIKKLASTLFDEGRPVIRITGLNAGSGKWYRVMKKDKDPRIGPWRFANYDAVNQWLWDNAKASLYLASNSVGEILHVGETGNKFKDRWRVSPAASYETNRKLPENQLFHTTGWPAIEEEYVSKTAFFPYEIRVVAPSVLRSVFEQWVESELPNEREARKCNDAVYVKVVEKELRKYRAQVRNDVGNLFKWNKR